MYGLLVLWLALTMVFFAMRRLPGDAVTATFLQHTQANIQARQQVLGLNDPLFTQYTRYLKNLLQGNLGYSYVSYESVGTLISTRMTGTISLGLGALGIAIALGALLGIASSLNEPRWLRYISDGFLLWSQAVPFYITALLFIYLFSLKLDWLPASGSSSPLSLILPASTLGLHTAGSIGRVLSMNLREAYQQNFMLTARAKGLPPIDLLDHALRVALLPSISVIALQAGFLLSGTIIIEVMFVRRGLGSLLYQSVLDRDYPTVQVLVLLGALLYMASNAFGNLIRNLLDPRLTHNE